MSSSTVVTALPTGVWQVDPSASELSFGARGMFGLVPVHGHFTAFTGTLTVDADGPRGELAIQADSLDTHNAKRDEHLRSADFFDVAAHPTVSFELTGVAPGAGGALTARGVLRIRDSALAIEAPLEVTSPSADSLVLGTNLEVDRTAAGVGWSKLGMIKGKAKLSARLTLSSQS